MNATFVSELPYGISESRMCVVHVDRNNLIGGAKSLQDVERTTKVSDIISQAPVALARTILTLQHATHYSYLGIPGSTDAKRLKELAGGSPDNFLAEGADTKGGAFIQKGLDYVPRVMQYVETIAEGSEDEPMAGRKILGWRIYYVPVDPLYDFDKALMNFFTVEAMRAKLRGVKGQRDEEAVFLRPYDSLAKWTKEGVFPYLNSAPSESDLNKALGKNLTSGDSFIKCQKIFSLERAIRWQQRIHPSLPVSTSDYRVYPHLPSDAYHMTAEDGIVAQNIGDSTFEFPEEVYQVPAIRTNPQAFFSIELERFYSRDVVSEEESGLAWQKDLEALHQSTKTQTDFEGMQEMIKTKKTAGEDVMAWIQTAEADRLIQNVMSNDVECPPSKATYEWYRKKPRDVCLVQPVTRHTDEKLTLLGNLASRDVLKMENDLGIFFLHQELLFLLVIAPMAFDLDTMGEVLIHAMFNGPPATGKSLLLKELVMCLITGTTVEITVQTKQAMYTTDEVFNGMLTIYDEVPPHFLEGADGWGISQLKTAMTKGVVRTKQCFINKDGKRLNLETVTKCKCINIIGSNPSEHRYPEPILSRLAPFSVPKRFRNDRNETVEAFASKEAGKKQTDQNEYRQEWHVRQFVASIIFEWVRLGALEPIDTIVPAIMIPRINAELTKAGYAIDPRMDFRFMIVAQAVCLYEAIGTVFFTDTHFPAGTPFRFSHVIQCHRYMVCKPRHVWLALGLVFNSMVKPFVENVLETLWLMVDETDEAQRYSTKRKGHQSVKDPDYYMIDVSQTTMIGSEGVVTEVCEAIRSRMASSNETLSRDNIRDVFHWLIRGGSFESHYTWDLDVPLPPGQVPSSHAPTFNPSSSGPPDPTFTKWRERDKPKMIPKILIRDSGTPRGVAISREFLEMMTDSHGKMRPECSTRGLLLRCIEATMSKEQKEDKTTKHVTGMSMRKIGKPGFLDVYRQSEVEKDRADSKVMRDEKEEQYFGGKDAYQLVLEERAVREAEKQAAKTEKVIQDEDYLRIGLENWSTEEETTLYAYRVEDVMPDETPEQYVARRAAGRKTEEKREREELEREELSQALRDKKGEKALVEYLVLIGKSALAGGDRTHYTKQEYLEAGKGVWEDTINRKWRKMEAVRIQEDQVILGECIVMARRAQEKRDAAIVMDPDQEIFVKSTVRDEWLDQPELRSEREGIAREMKKFNEKRLEIGLLAEERWQTKTGWTENPVPKLPWTFRYSDYPRSKEPKDFKRRLGVTGFVAEVAAKRRKAREGLTTTTGTVYES